MRGLFRNKLTIVTIWPKIQSQHSKSFLKTFFFWQHIFKDFWKDYFASNSVSYFFNPYSMRETVEINPSQYWNLFKELISPNIWYSHTHDLEIEHSKSCLRGPSIYHSSHTMLVLQNIYFQLYIEENLMNSTRIIMNLFWVSLHKFLSKHL